MQEKGSWERELLFLSLAVFRRSLEHLRRRHADTGWHALWFTRSHLLSSCRRGEFCLGTLFFTVVRQVRFLQGTVSIYWNRSQPLAERKQVTSLTLSSTFFNAAVGCRCFVIFLAAGENPTEIYICFVAKLNLASFWQFTLAPSHFR